MSETIRLEDMRLFARVAEERSFTAAARALGVPKQTLSRRVAALERALGVTLMHRTTRRLQLSDVGAAYAERCAELSRVADEANRAITDTTRVPRGRLRVTADPVFGEAFLSDVVVAYARRWPEVALEVLLTRRHVDLVEEGFDVAFRIGAVDDPALSAERLGPARVRYCASPRYVSRRGSPAGPADLRHHDCIVVASEGVPTRWPFPGAKGPLLIPVTGRLLFSSFPLARAATLAGLGIGIFPEFACAEDLRKRRLVPVLGGVTVDVGAVWLVHAARRALSMAARAFADLARERLGRRPPWVQAEPRVRRARSRA